MRENLRQTINGTFDLYKIAAKKLYGLSLSYSIISSIFAVLISALVCLIAVKIIGNVSYYDDSIFESILYNPLAGQRFTDIAKGILILNIGLYGIFLIRVEQTEFDEKYTLKKMRNTIPSDVWNLYFVLLGIVLFINGFLFKQIFDTTSDNTGLVELFGYFDPSNKKIKFYNWINSMVELIKLYLPYFLSMLLIFFYYVKKINIHNLKKYRNAFFSAVILSFCIETIANEVVNYINYYIISLIKIPFVNELIPGLFGFLIGILLIAFFYLAFSASISYPFKYEHTKITLPNK